MTFTTKDWQDAPSTVTPIDAAALEDLESRLAGYTDSVVAGLTIAEVPGLQAALDALQASATAATDAELATAVGTLNAAISGKQDAESAATDAELAAAIATINTSLAAKQDASGAATDAELATAVATVNASVAAQRRVVAGGSLGATPSLSMLTSDRDVWLTGTLTANANLTITGLLAAQSVRLLLAQDATGGRTLSVTVGGSTAAVTFPTAANAVGIVDCLNDGTDLYVRGA
jgi:hypothetical protein